MDDFILIQLDFAGKVHRLTCRRSEESAARKAARRVKGMLGLYEERFDLSKIDAKDLLAMLAFHFSFESQLEKAKEDISPIFDRLEQLSLEIEEYIESGK
jgi:hypothetical protein